MAVKITPKERHIASEIARHKGRTGVMINQLGIHLLAAKRIYREVNNEPPKSGLLPSSTESNFQPIQRLHASLLMRLYSKSLGKLKKISAAEHQEVFKYDAGELPDINPAKILQSKEVVKFDKATAFISSYDAYIKIVGEQAVIDINRFDFLVRDLFKTSELKMPKEIIQWATCRTCRAVILRQFNETSTKCPKCEGSLLRSRTLMKAFRNRDLNLSDA